MWRRTQPKLLPQQHRKIPEYTVIINLPHRVDRRTLMETQLQAAGFSLKKKKKIEEWGSEEDERSWRNTSLPRVDFYPAVVGKNLNPQKLQELGFISRLGYKRLAEAKGGVDKIWGMDLTYGAMGCALSHIDLWGKIRAGHWRRRGSNKTPTVRGQEEEEQTDSGNISAATPPLTDSSSWWHEPVLVFEDDSLVPENFLDEYDAVLKVLEGLVFPLVPSPSGSQFMNPASSPSPSAWQDNIDLVYLSGLDTEGQCDQLIIKEFFPNEELGHQEEGLSRRVMRKLCHVPRMHRTTNCYLTTPAGCHRLLMDCVPLTYQLDTQMTLHAEPLEGGVLHVTKPRSLTVRPSIVVQSTEMGSDIQTN